MTTWINTTDTGQSWATQEGQASVWDSGASVWDQADNVSLSSWDVADTAWSATAETGTVWS